ncbi:MAG TPA: phosphate regulon sensor histidine kinase PhoR, partial [Burkholderiales bacterium]|nr:phosphate regulon sensor histidine kinase PhoR [Burkholderiales bacterium]
MSPVYRSTLVSLASLAAVALIAWAAAGAALGLSVFAAGLLALLVYHVRHLARFGRWVSHPVRGKVPEGAGSWDAVLAALHHFEREAAKREEMLADALARLRRAAQALPDGVVILDADHRIEWCNDNAAAMLGLDARADIGRPIANLLREPAFVDYLASPDQAGTPAFRAPIAQGLVLDLRLVPYGEAQKLLLCRDVTHAERVETMRRDFVANVSHELRTPLTVLVGFLETVRELKLDPSRVRDYLGMMREQASRMHRIIEDLLTLSVLESAPPPTMDRVRMASLLARLRLEAEALSGGRHSILVEGRPTLDLLGSETELASAFGNLVSNAIRYTPPGGKVAIHWREDDSGASLTVEDTGPGIAPEHLPRLTERFYRVDR